MKKKMYKLEAFTYEGSPQLKNLDTETPYRAREYYYRTLDSAEAEIQRILSSDDPMDELLVEYVWFFLITEIPIGKDLYNHDITCPERVYLKDGKLLSEYPMLYGQSRTFRGRKPEDCTFKQGDIVMVYHGEDIPPSFSIVAELPPSPEFCRLHPARYTARDDAYLTLHGDGPYIESHEHPCVTQLLPLCIDLPEEKIDELYRALERYQSEDIHEDLCNYI